MKYRYFLAYFIVCSCFFHNVASAQLVGDNAFMQGKWLEVCIAPNGSWGNSMPVPAGYTSRGGSSVSYRDPITGVTPAGNGLDFSYNQGHIDWATGPWYGAYFLPGTPFDGWSIEIDDTMASAFYSNIGLGHPAFDTTEGGNFGGTVTSWSGPTCWSPHAALTGTWQGTYGLKRAGLRNALQITQVNEVDTLASWLIVTTKFYNASDSILRGVYYMATADPDNDEDLPGGSFPTDNHISYQGGLYDRHEVNARPDPGSHPLAFSGLATQDCRAKVLIYQSWPPSMTPGNNLNRVWAGTTTSMGSTYYTLGATTVSQDIAYGLIFQVGDIAPGDSAFISYAWIFTDTTAVDSIFSTRYENATPELVTLGVLHTTTQPDSVFGCTVAGCGVAGLTFTADIVNGENRNWTYSTWSWTPAIGLSVTSGRHVVCNIASLTGPVTYTITGTPDAIRGSCLTPAPVTFTMYVEPCFHASNNSTICVTDTLKLFAHGDSTGASYFWYGPGFTAYTQNPFRTGMIIADTGWYTVVRTVGSSNDTARTYVTLKPLPVVTATSNAPICSGAPNILNLTVAPDSVGETFIWSGPNGFSSGLISPSVLNPPVSNSGNYKVKGTLNGCTDSAIIFVVIDSTPAIPTTGNNTPICSHRDRLILTSGDVTPGVSYSWTGPGGYVSAMQNPVILPDVPVAASGIYTVTVTLGICSNFNTTTVLVDKTPNLPVMGSNGPLCSGNPLYLTSTSDVGSTYTWTGPNSFVSILQNPSIIPATTLASGTYYSAATIIYPGIPGGCVSDTASLAVIVDSVVVAGFNYAIKYGCKADTVDFTNTSTEAVYFKWIFGDGNTSIIKNPTHIYTVQNMDTVVLIAMAGVCRSTDTQVINLVHPLHAMFNADTNLICQGNAINFTDSSITTIGPTGILPGYLWNFGDGNTFADVNPPAHTYPHTGTYKVFEIVTDFVPCHDTAYKTITVDSISPIHFSVTDSVLCGGTYVTFNGNYTSIGNTGVTWNFDDGDTIKNENPVKYAYTATGVFTITATALYRVCPDISVSRVVTVVPQPSINIGSDTTICKGSESFMLMDKLNEGNKNASWIWNTGATTAGISVGEPGTYTATVRIDGCYATATVEVKNDCYMTIPNVFTPNGDGMNDYFFPRQFLTSGLVTFSMKIFNRWGELIFQTTSLDGYGWDGRYNNVEQPSGVYVYIIDGTFKDGQKEHHQGNITLLR